MDAVDRLFALVGAKYKEQKDFAADIGVAPSKVSEWKKRKAKSYTKYLPKISEVLGTTTEYILTGNENQLAPLTGDELVDAVRGLNAENRKKAQEYVAMLRELQDRQ
mgnify:CR=1 FL=1